MAQLQEQQAQKSKKIGKFAKRILVSAARSLKRVFTGKKLDNAFLNAASRGDNAAIKRFIKVGASVANTSALHDAAWTGHTETCDLLLHEFAKTGGNMKKFILAKRSGMTALHRAAINGHTKTCAFLLNEYAEAGGDIKELLATRDGIGRTAKEDARYNIKIDTTMFLDSVEWLADATGNAFMKSFAECTA
jgi:ankyrin repeat protein